MYCIVIFNEVYIHINIIIIKLYFERTQPKNMYLKNIEFRNLCLCICRNVIAKKEDYPAEKHNAY